MRNHALIVSNSSKLASWPEPRGARLDSPRSPFTKEPTMDHSTALVTGATSGVGYAAARLLAEEGWREIIVTGRSLGRAQETAAQLAAETKMQVFAPLALDLDKQSSVRSALAKLVKRGRPVDFLLLNAGVLGG